MSCAWQAYLNLIPHWMRSDVDRIGKDKLLELRLRIEQEPQLLLTDETIVLPKKITGEDLAFVINAGSRYSPWAAETTANGYITAPGGHRIGVCGCGVVSNHKMSGIRIPTSVNIRVSRDFPGCAAIGSGIGGSILIVGKPGTGKTTLLRDLIRQRSNSEIVAVVDEKYEIFPMYHDSYCFYPGSQVDVLSGVNKEDGIQMLIRNMGPQTIAVDEITAREDSAALLRAAWCGVSILATAHAANLEELKKRTVYRLILKNGIFDAFIVTHPDKSWHIERRVGC